MNTLLLNVVKVAVTSATFCLALSACDSTQQPTVNGNTQSMDALEKITPPVAKKVPHKLELHGETRIDNYYWLRDDDRKDPEILAHLNAENQYTDAMLAHTQTMQQQLFNEITSRIEKNDDSVPYKKGNYYYYSRYIAEGEYPIYARKHQKLDAPEQVTLDVNQLAKGKAFYSLSALEYSPNEQLVAYAADELSRGIYQINIKDLTTGELLDDTLVEAEASMVFSADSQYLFYIKQDLQTLLGNKVYRHKLGTEQSEDVLVYEETDSSLYLDLGMSDDGQVLMLERANSTSASVMYLNANKPLGEFKLFQPHETFVQYDIYPHGDHFFYVTNKDAVNFQMYRIHKDQINQPQNWQLILPHREDVYLTEIDIFDDYLAIIEKSLGLNHLVIYDHQGKKLREINFDDAAYTIGLDDNPNNDSQLVRIEYSSLTTPDSIYDVNMATGDKQLLKQDKVLGDFDPSLYQSERFMVTARDGAKVPVSLVYRKDLFKKDGTNPLYQYAYGSYGSNVEPYFSSTRLSLLNRGFVYAIAHIRGSSTMGRQWYEDGKLLNKKNTFNDFIDVTKALVAQHYGHPKKVVASGGSAGGLLMGAIANMAPELYFAIGAHVPWVDVVTTMNDPSIPLTTNEYTEWGNPADEEYYHYMLSYSPYDQVKAQAYPHLFVTTGLHDSQVQYFEPAKWVAKLRELKTDDNKLLMDVNMDAGHGGASGRFKKYKLVAKEFAFYFDLLGIKE